MKTEKTSTKTLVQIAVFTAIIAILAQLAIPMPNGVPVTLQTFAIALTGYMLGPVFSLCSVGLYILLGLVGAPVFANLRGGLPVILGPAGGFIIGFLPMALLTGLGSSLVKKFSKKTHVIITILICFLFSLAGLACCHFGGVLWFNKVTEKNSLSQSFLLVSLPFIIKDVLSVLFAVVLGFNIRDRVEVNS